MSDGDNQSKPLAQNQVPPEIEKKIEQALEGTVEGRKRREAVQRVTQIFQTQINNHSSYMPPADQMERYELLYPGFAKALMENFLAESAHRRDMDKIAIQGDIKLGEKHIDAQLKAVYAEENSRRGGMIGSLLVSIGVLALAGYVAFLGHPGSAATIAVGIGGIVAFKMNFRNSADEETAKPQPSSQSQNKKK